MGIEWTTVVFNIVNFLILVWLLKRFLYKPVINAMDKREDAIRTRLNDAALSKEEAEKEAEAYRKKTTAFEEEKKTLWKKVQDEASQERKTLLKEAQQEMKDKKAGWEAQMNAEREALHNTVRELVAKTLINESRHALKEMADETLETQIANVFIRKLGDLKKEEKEELKKNYTKNKLIEIDSSFDLPSDTKSKIENAIATTIGESKVATKYKTDKNIICGLELRVGSQSINWGFDGYIENFEKNLDTALANLTSSFEG